MKEHKTFADKVGRYLGAGFPILYLHTFEDEKADKILAAQSGRSQGRILEWNETEGYVEWHWNAESGEIHKWPYGRNEDFKNASLEEVLALLRNPDILNGTTIVFRDLNHYLNEQGEQTQVAAKLRGLAAQINAGLDANLVIVSNTLVLPAELEQHITILEMDYPNTEEIRAVIEAFCREQGTDMREGDLQKFTEAFKGLTEYEIRQLLQLAYAGSGGLKRKDLDLVYEQKRQVIQKAGLLEMIPLKNTDMNRDIGGLEALKTWLRKKAHVYQNIDKAMAYGVDMPKGVLIVGVPGCGKSLSAKAAASLFDTPLLRLDMGRLMGKYVGESENNLRKAIALAEAVSPCVLWIDELEKAFAGIGGETGNGEVTTRLFGNFLTWMQEKTGPVFVVATANDLSQLPPELLRKGRFDEIFSVDLPNAKERKAIFSIHLQKRKQKALTDDELRHLADKTGEFSGADIEAAVKEAVETAFCEGKPGVTLKDIEAAVANTNPTGKAMREKLEQMRKMLESRKFRKASKEAS